MDKLIETINDMHDLLRNMEMDKWEDLEAESETFDNHLKSMRKAIDLMLGNELDYSTGYHLLTSELVDLCKSKVALDSIQTDIGNIQTVMAIARGEEV